MEIADRLEKLEAAPKWVGLTDEELLELSKDAWGRNKLHLGRSDHTGFYIDFGPCCRSQTQGEERMIQMKSLNQ
jgi:hypothetical protein